ncbi:uncharacterized protein LOC112508593 [Cynara cardunculus var. scolymus]|uniref:C2 calcium-dependent membrane targeting n=1 Tax=Cynara cardunculus var. scolymus TaxID=59895 RepID=A0A103YDX2_CYNCS|nr:uncharacterized protein LOC112508593 [Cynara cardunculus var. scolymus]KVI07296.1 C2 calcium-dependent membrane targeting [Cynara cardunculus var. scolymus]
MERTTTTIPTPPASSTVTSASSPSLQAPPPAFQHLEINLISAQDLSLSAKSMKTYAMAYLHPNRKLSTLVDTKGNTNPTWNEKLMFKIDDQFLFSESSSLTIEIYNVSWFRDVLVGSVNVLIDDLITPEHKHYRAGSRFVTLQIRRPSGTPQGIMNMGYTLGNANEQGVPLYSEFSGDKKPENEAAIDLEDGKLHVHEKIHLWRSRSVDEIDDEDDYPGSVYNGSMVNGSEICSDVGPSASIVAAEIAQKSQPPPSPRPPLIARRPVMRNAEDGGSSILGELTMEEALAKGWLVDFPAHNRVARRRNHPRRHSDGGGLFSCFALGIEFHIVCGSANKQSSSNAKRNRARNRKGSG